MLQSRCLQAARRLAQRQLSSLPAQEPTDPCLPPFDHTPAPYTGPSKEEVRTLRQTFLNPAIMHHFKEPVMIVEGKQQYLYDETGKRFLDAFAGIVTVSVGHCHPKVLKAIEDQNKLLQHTTTIYLNPQVAQYAKELTDRMPGNLKVPALLWKHSGSRDCVDCDRGRKTCIHVAYFVNSGSEANDLAVLMARLHTGNYDLVALRNCYHGLSETTMGMMGNSSWRQPVPCGLGVRHALNPDPYRGAFGNDGPRYAEDVRDLIQSATCGQIAAFCAETIQGVGGSVPLADGYLPAVYQMVREAGGVTIADEVQSGFGRTGSNYWGFQNQGVQPDIVTMAKGIGNGLPLAAVVTTPEIARSLATRSHLNTFGGNPVCCAGGRAVLQAIDEDRCQENSAKVGAHMKGRLQQLQQRHDVIGDVRGLGLMLGIEMVKDRTSKAPAVAETAQVWERLKDMGILLGKGGLRGSVFRIKPPMCFNMQDADFLVDALDKALCEL